MTDFLPSPQDHPFKPIVSPAYARQLAEAGITEGYEVMEKVTPTSAPLTDARALKPCPFCSRVPNEFYLVLTLWIWGSGFYVSCRCGARGPLRVTKERAKYFWNVRPIVSGGNNG